MFYPLIDTFYSGSPAVDFDAIRQAGATEGPFEIVCVIDQEHRVSDVVFIEELDEKYLPDLDPYASETAECGELGDLRIDRGVEPILFFVDANHGLVQRDAIWRPPWFYLQSGLLDPVVNRRSTACDPEVLKKNNSISG